MEEEVWNDEAVSDEEDDSDDAEEQTMSSEGSTCTKLRLADNIAAYMKREQLVSDKGSIDCDIHLTERVVSNYIIAKRIISNLSWQDKILCKIVCTTWHSAVLALAKEQLNSEDFVLDIQKSGVHYKKSGNYDNEPLVVFTFTNHFASFGAACKCSVISPSPCTAPCDMKHCLLDYVQQQVSAPKNCMITVKASNLSYMPLSTTTTFKHSLNRKLMMKTHPFVCGLYIPNIPNVGFQVLNIKSSNTMKENYYDVVDKIVQDYTIKGVIVYVTDKYLLDSFEEIAFLNYFKDVQPDTPYALGGCIIEDVTSDNNDVDTIISEINKNKDIISDNIISMGIFTVAKVTGSDGNGDKFNFEMFSLVIEAYDWTKPQIQKRIQEFAAKVPHFEHSAVLKLSCVGRDQRHDVEQDYFRAAFPNTRLIGCYGNGEIGLNHPAVQKSTERPNNTVKRRRNDSYPQFGIMYSYSTVFVYMGWGKITSPGNLNN